LAIKYCELLATARIKSDFVHLFFRTIMSAEAESSVVGAEKVMFPSSIGVTYQKMKDTVMKFVDLGGSPFTQKQIEEKMKDLGNIRVVAQRVIPYLKYLGFLTRSRIGKGGSFTYKLVPEIREKLEKNPEEYDSIFAELCKGSPAYLVIQEYAKEEDVNKFLVSSFEQQHITAKFKIPYSKTGLGSWLNALDKVKLLSLKDGFISLEGIPSSPKLPPEALDDEKSKNLSSQKSGNPPPDEGVAPGMNINVDLRLDYRQTPDLQREYMQWLDKMSSKPTVRMSIKRSEEGRESTTEKKTDQS